MAKGGWRRRPVMGAAVGVGAAAVPAVVGFALMAALRPLLPAAGGGRGFGVAAIVGLGVLAGAGAERLARRLLPLRWLLGLSLVFPGAAPSRLRSALAAGSPRTLQRLLESPAVAPGEADAAAAILRLSAALTAHHRSTRGHSERVRGYAEMLGRQLGVAEEDLAKLRWAALLHDIGKLEVAAAILAKPARLDDHERAVLLAHPEAGMRIAAPLLPWLGEWADAIAHHHERWDGSGYPRGLAGSEISLGGRIVAVADAFEAMTARRSYQTPRTLEEARREVVAHAGTQFDPLVVRALLEVSVARLGRPAGAVSGLAALPALLGGIAARGLGATLPAVLAAAGAVGAVVSAGSVEVLPPVDAPAADVLAAESQAVEAAGGAAVPVGDVADPIAALPRDAQPTGPVTPSLPVPPEAPAPAPPLNAPRPAAAPAASDLGPAEPESPTPQPLPPVVPAVPAVPPVPSVPTAGVPHDPDALVAPVVAAAEAVVSALPAPDAVADAVSAAVPAVTDAAAAVAVAATPLAEAGGAVADTAATAAQTAAAAAEMAVGTASELVEDLLPGLPGQD